MVQEAEKHKAPPGTFRESIRPQKYSGVMSQLINAEPSTYKEVASQQVWNDAMIEEYSSIMKNDVWEVVPRPTGKSVVTSRWLCKIKHVVDGSIELVALLKKKALTMMRHLLLSPGILLSKPSFLLLQYSDGSYIRWM